MNTYSIDDPRTSLPAGEYYIGDPCYVIKDEEWMQCLNETRYFNMFIDDEHKDYRGLVQQNGTFRYKPDDVSSGSYIFAASGTKYGDGCYPCRNNGVDIGECGVDAGLIACIPIEMIKDYGEESGLDDGVIHEFESPFEFDYDDGMISFGDVTVNTDDEEW